MRITSFPERLKIIGLDPLVGHHQVIAHHLHEVGLALAHLQMRLLFLLQVPKAHLLGAHQREPALVDLQQPVVRHLLALVLLHQQLEVLVVYEESALFLHQQVVTEGMDVANRHFQLVDLFQSVLGTRVDLVDCELLLAQGEELVAAAELNLDDIASQLVVSDLLCAEVEESDLRLALSHLPEEIIHLLALCQFEGEDAVKGMQLDGIELSSSDDFPLLDLFLLVLCKRPPPEDVFLQLILAIFIEDEQNTVIRSHYRGVHINLVLQFQHCLLRDLLILSKVIHLHLVVLLHRELIFHFLADGGLEHEAGLSVAHLDDLLDDFVGETVDYDLKFVLPHQDPSFFEVDADQAPAISYVQIFNGVFLGVGVEDRHSVGLELPLLDSLVGNAEVVAGFCLLTDNFLELLLLVGESTQLLSSFLRAEHYLRSGDLRVRFMVDIDDVVQFLDPVVSLLQFSGGIDLEHLVGAPPIKVDLGRMVDGLDDGQFQQLIITLLILRQMHLHWLKFLLEFAMGIDAPTVNQLIFAVLVRSEYGGIPIAGFNFLYHSWDLHIIHHFPFLQRYRHHAVQSKDSQVLVVDGSDLGAKLFILIEHLYGILKNHAIDLIEKDPRAVNIDEMVANHHRLIQRRPTAIILLPIPVKVHLLLHQDYYSNTYLQSQTQLPLTPHPYFYPTPNLESRHWLMAEFHKKKQPTNYGEHAYWDQRYSKSEGERYEWLQHFENLQAEVEKSINYNKDCRILHIGCGNSALQDRFYEAGYHHIVNIDISGVVIAQMDKVKAEKGYDKMVYQVMDVRKLEYENQSFDLAIDKSTIDTLMCSDNPIMNVAMMVDEVYRVLRPNGIYFVLSYASAATRIEHITRKHVNWEVQKKQVTRINQDGQELVHFIYICRKLPLEQERTRQQWREEYFKELKALQEKEYPS